MGWFTSTINSSLGKKYLMALTGLFLVIYLAIHLFGNSFIYAGDQAFNEYVAALTESKLKYVIRVIEIVLFLGFLVHIFDGIKLTIDNFSARPNRYAVKPANPQSALSSRTMWITAAVVFFFLVVHMKQFWYVYHSASPEMHFSMYKVVVDTFSDPAYSLLYLASVLFLGFHLYHGFQSAFQTLGLNHTKYRQLIINLGRIYAVIITIGFASFPVVFLMKRFFLGGNL